MKKNWYAVYTKAQSEKRASLLLNKKRIENFCPLNSVIKGNYGRKKMFNEPLFPSFVFVNIHESEMSNVRQTSEVMNFVYWLGKPAVIKNAEIENIHQFVTSYYNIIVEKSIVNPSGLIHIIKDKEDNINDSTEDDSQVDVIKVALPSLGYIMKAESKKTIPDSLKYNFTASKLFA